MKRVIYCLLFVLLLAACNRYRSIGDGEIKTDIESPVLGTWLMNSSTATHKLTLETNARFTIHSEIQLTAKQPKAVSDVVGYFLLEDSLLQLHPQSMYVAGKKDEGWKSPPQLFVWQIKSVENKTQLYLLDEEKGETSIYVQE
ncbi:hypothetical protein LX64_00366 [Chitinophaga skermanii]|uniref:Lipocalin-like protein n=1 Tax=Chitinophaga skermanii TaxID=331697 RepID=A0A327R1N4_9BACT|nr:hypothetical protein [Chitinophaga skermanii]RAJ10759.1 hypothetical protein LX64_00366 [Chitinophaga skermanii]